MNVTNQNVQLKNLEPFHFLPNWSVTECQLKKYLLLRTADHMESITDSFVNALRTTKTNSLKVGLAADRVSDNQTQVSLRVIQTVEHSHHSKVDVVIRKQGQDLFVQFETAARSGLKYLRILFYGWFFLLLWGILLMLLFSSTGMFQAVLQQHGERYTSDPTGARLAMISGWRIDESTQQWVPSENANIIGVLRSDPGLVISSLGIPMGIIAAVAGGFVSLLPSTAIYVPCRLLGWPTPEEFDAFVHANAAWIEGVLSMVLMHEFGIDETQKMAS